MRYVSTRGGVRGLSFCDAVMMGLANDGGLLVPETIPDVSADLPQLKEKSYAELAAYVMGHFIDDIPASELRLIIESSYNTFDDSAVTPLVEVGDIHVLELFHGPTLAFKDVALQFLGNVFEYVLNKRGGRLNILGATSGDTGSAAIAGLRGKQNINVFIMFPEGRMSALQEKQMTTVLDNNVQNLAIEGSFDDCQSILKTIFNDLDFKGSYGLGAVNSVNWARILAQVVYYFSAYVQLGLPERFQVAVPTGNFGNIFAGYIARRMGLPIDSLILATNQNDILHRFFTTGRYERGDVYFSHSPAMDIQVASNFERYLYFEFDQEPEKVKEFIKSFSNTGLATTNFNTLNADAAFTSGRVSDEDTVERITKVFDESEYLLDPHTAVGVEIGLLKRQPGIPLVCLATAHPAKFDEVISQVIPDVQVSHPTLDLLKDLPERKTLLEREAGVVKDFISTFNDQLVS
ncbi:threonine synthase [Gammaproteobacteria bacterium]|nr:threonine synthase [Gammaproteobacteria bacterium]